MKRLLLLSLLLITVGIQAQNVPPQAINFQGIAIDKNGVPVPGMDEVGNPIQNAAIRIRFTVLMGSSTGTPSYQEEHLTNTDEFGRFNLEIGRGTALLGQFTDINWGADRHFLKVETDLTGIGSAYTLSSVQEFLSVPYALYAKTAGNSTASGDQDSTNEIQQLSLNGTALSLSKANTVNLPPDSDAQQLQVSGNTLSISGGNNVQLPVSLDNDTTNELQSLILIGDTLKISNGNSVIFPGSSINQTLLGTSSPNNLCLYGGDLVSLESLALLYNTITPIAITVDNVFAFCQNSGQGLKSLYKIHRVTNVFNQVSISPVNSGDFYRSSDSILFFIGNNAIQWLNLNNTTQHYISSNSYVNLTGNAMVDYKTNALYFEHSGGWHRFNYLSNSYQSMPLATGMKSIIGKDSILVGSNLYNGSNANLISNLGLSPYEDPVTRIGNRLIYKRKIAVSSISNLCAYDLTNSVNKDITNNFYYLNINGVSQSDPIIFSSNAIAGNLIIEYSGMPYRRINNHVITASGLSSVGSYAGSPYLSTSKEVLSVSSNGYVRTMWYGSLTDYNQTMQRIGNYTIIRFDSFGCHNGSISASPGLVIYDAR
jgi:hypothetical protein